MDKIINFVRNNRTTLLALAEMSIIFIWALWVGRIYLDFDPYNLPGRANDDFLLSILPYYPFQRLFVCGDCVLWNGLLNGGSPTLGDSIGGMLHPVMLLLIPTFGVHNGIKLSLVAALIMGGWGQWWTGKVLNLSLPARLWMGFFAVTAGNLAGASIQGAVGIIFSVSATSLVIAPIIKLAMSGNKKDAIVLGLMIGQALLSGQSYLQLALITCILPATLIFVLNEKNDFWKQYQLAILLGFSFAAIAILPILSFSFEIISPGEPLVRQPIEYIPVNFVIRNLEFFHQELEILGSVVSPGQFLNYIGWLPIILVFIAWRFIPESQMKIFYFFVLSCGLLLLLASGTMLSWIRALLPELGLGMRNLGFSTGLMVSLIISLSGWGAHFLLEQRWPVIHISKQDSEKNLKINTIIILIPVFLLSLKNVYDFNSQIRFLEKWPDRYIEALANFPKEKSGWIRPPYGNWPMVAGLNNQNVKVTDAYRIWDIKERNYPEYQWELSDDNLQISNPDLIQSFNGYYFIENKQSFYAFVQTTQGNVPCEAKSDGGHIDILCDINVEGYLLVRENALPGWNAKIENKKINLIPHEWLKIYLPKGKHEIKFRYSSVPFGIGAVITLLALVFGTWMWFKPEELFAYKKSRQSTKKE